jgi:NAD(P)H dehydrogenase (quinone)
MSLGAAVRPHPVGHPLGAVHNSIHDMRCLIVFAHPEKNSYNGSLHRTAVDALRGAGHEVAVSDLYADGFEAVGGRRDFIGEASPEVFSYHIEQLHAHERGLFSEDLRREQQRLLDAELVIFQFPLWWYGMPAILKGWVDRVFAYGFAYGGGRWYDRGIFRDKRAMLIVTTGGPQSAYGADGLQGPIDSILYPIHHGILQFVGMSVLEPFVAYSADTATDEGRAEVLGRLRTRLTDIPFEAGEAPVRVDEFGPDLRRLT